MSTRERIIMFISLDFMLIYVYHENRSKFKRFQGENADDVCNRH